MSQPPTESGSGKPQTPSGKGGSGGHVFQAPTGTRDMYPAELARLRYVQDAWRRTSINHGFEEIDGPTFEHLDLYTVKSGEGIVSELFSFERFGGEKTFALRPEFTPTLARMYAAKAASLPKPTKWFWMQNCFRAERPQRGRLREFWQWNCDIIGNDSPANDAGSETRADAEIICTCASALQALGLRGSDVQVRLNDRRITEHILRAEMGIEAEQMGAVTDLLDQWKKRDRNQLHELARQQGLSDDQFEQLGELATHQMSDLTWEDFCQEHFRKDTGWPLMNQMSDLLQLLADAGLQGMFRFDPSIVRGLAYYTGMVFEVHEASGAERAIAGGGRYDKLIEMFGGPPTPAVGFGMGDVVLSLVLADKGLMPKDDEIASRLGLNPDAVVVSNGTPEADEVVAKVVADLRRAGLHARRSSKKIGKAMQDAAKVRARYCVILESATQATVKDMGTQEQAGCGVGELVERLKRR